jgi:hypothetical protein
MGRQEERGGAGTHWGRRMRQAAPPARPRRTFWESARAVIAAAPAIAPAPRVIACRLRSSLGFSRSFSCGGPKGGVVRGGSGVSGGFECVWSPGQPGRAVTRRAEVARV